MPPELWATTDAYAASLHHDRSSWIRLLVVEALSKAGVLPNDPVAAELIRTRELIAAAGIDAVRAKHDELIQKTVSAAA